MRYGYTIIVYHLFVCYPTRKYLQFVETTKKICHFMLYLDNGECVCHFILAHETGFRYNFIVPCVHAWVRRPECYCWVWFFIYFPTLMGLIYGSQFVCICVVPTFIKIYFVFVLHFIAFDRRNGRNITFEIDFIFDSCVESCKTGTKTMFLSFALVLHSFDVALHLHAMLSIKKTICCVKLYKLHLLLALVIDSSSATNAICT